MGEPIEVAYVSNKAGGYVEVRGLVESEARKSELRTALAELASVQVHIRTAEEALLKATSPEFQLSDQKPVTIRAEALRLSSGRSPIQQELKEFLAGSQGIAAFSTHAISLSQGALTHAWALRRLAERYSRGEEIALVPRSRWLLEIMSRDHRVALETGNRRMRALLEPVLKRIQSKFDLQPAPAPVSRIDADWRAVSLDAFEATDQIDKLARMLFAGADPLQIDGSGDSRTFDSGMAQEHVRELIGAFQRLDLLLSAMQVRTSEDGFQ